jgi:ribose 1,5-bisphosphokinase PhnN
MNRILAMATLVVVFGLAGCQKSEQAVMHQNDVRIDSECQTFHKLFARDMKAAVENSQDIAERPYELDTMSAAQTFRKDVINYSATNETTAFDQCVIEARAYLEWHNI